MDDSCAVCAETLEWVAYGPCGHREVCSTCVVRLRFILGDRRCCICKTECPTVFVTKAMGDYTEVKSEFSEFPPGVSEGQHGQYWYHEDSQAYFNDVDHYRMIRAMCKLSCSICDASADDQKRDGSNRRNKFRNIEQLKGHLFHQHKMFMCSLCLEGRKVFISEQKLYTRLQLRQHISTGNTEVDGTESERGGFAGHPICEFCRNPFYGDTELYMHMSMEHYTCHICQRQHPGQYDYYRNYDDLEAHFRQEHFLCENEACLAKKFVVFQTEADMKRHNAIEHGGNMSRSKRNAALQIPVSFRYRQSNLQEQRRGRGRGFYPEPLNNQLVMAVHGSLETAVAEERSHESSSTSRTNSERRETNQPDTISNFVEFQAISSHADESSSRSAVANRQSSGSGLVVEDISFPPFSNIEPPESSHRYAQALNQGSSARLGEASFPPLPGVKDSIKPKVAPVSEGSTANSIAARLNLQNKASVKVLHSAQPKPLQNYEVGFSSSASSSEVRPLTQNHDPVASTSKSLPWVTNNQVAPLTSTASPQGPAIRASGFAVTIPSNSPWNSNNMCRMKHSSSAPNLSSSGPSNNPASRIISSVTSNQEIPSSIEPSQHLENVHTANKTLVESIRAALGMDEEKYAAFKTISAEYRQDQINTLEYLSHVDQFGLSHLVLELARLCPDPHKQRELINAYNANLHGKGLQESSSNAVGTKKDRKKGKGKGKAFDHSKTPAIADSLADSILDQVRKLQTCRHPFEDEVEVLTKDGYRTAKDKVPSSANGLNNWGLVIADDSSSERETITRKNSGGGEGGKKNRKTSKFHRIRLGDGSAAAFLDQQCQADTNPERTGGEHNTNQAEGLPARGVWSKGGGQRLFS